MSLYYFFQGLLHTEHAGGRTQSRRGRCDLVAKRGWHLSSPPPERAAAAAGRALPPYSHTSDPRQEPPRERRLRRLRCPERLVSSLPPFEEMLANLAKVKLQQAIYIYIYKRCHVYKCNFNCLALVSKPFVRFQGVSLKTI